MTSTSMSELAGKRTLIVGDVGTGKTNQTRRLMEEALSLGLGPVTVMDMAPEARVVNGTRVGGPLLDANVPGVRVLRNRCIKTPRLSAVDAKDLVEQALHNAVVVEGLLEQFRASPSPVLFINDVSIYLQLGDLGTLWDAIAMAETVVANGYLGERLRDDRGSGVSERERRGMEELADRFHVVVRL
ncbi:MAG TPA: hypothetical protein VMW22_00330 [Candidatus Desulfaltia sp.]|nr:hypothetical protein [Candidatus Desulfaltia sp.]